MEVEDEVAGKVSVSLRSFIFINDSQTSNAADNLASLLALLSHPSGLSENHADQTSKSVIFILDDFDLFTSHARQALLYNLFDIAQSSKAPILVLGVTTRVDVVESLEKRVKSRFSHRYVHLSLPKSLPAFWEICKDGLLTDAEELESAGCDVGLAGQDKCLSFWQSMIEVSILLQPSRSS
jgi:origin recognition complex subunit 4